MNQKGFSLIEVSVSIAIITIGLMSIIALFSANIQNEIKNKNKLIAVYLANESIEIVRQKRDNNWFSVAGWKDGIPDGNVAVVPQNMNDIRKGWNVVPAGVDTDERKVYLTNDDIYLNNAVTATDTGFERYLTITVGDGDDIDLVAIGCFDSTDCMEVVSHVSFHGVQLVELTAYFYDGWY